LSFTFVYFDLPTRGPADPAWKVPSLELDSVPERPDDSPTSFSRALTEGLSVHQSDEEFDAILKHSIESILEASLT
jgi:hypothetical protein